MPIYSSQEDYRAAVHPRLNVDVDPGRVLGHTDYWPNAHSAPSRRWVDDDGRFWHLAFQRDESARTPTRDDERGDLVATLMEDPPNTDSPAGPVRVLAEDQTFGSLEAALGQHGSEHELAWVEGRLRDADLLAT